MKIGLLWLIWPASGADATPLRIEDLDLGELMGVVGAASRKEQSLLRAPAAATVLQRRALLRTGARSVPELLSTVPGVQVLRIAPGSFVVSLRGMGGLEGNNVVVTLDGVPLNRRLDGSVDWSSLPVSVEDLERVEIVRGPVSTLYGANAYTGVIALISREPGGTRAHVEGRVDDQAAVGLEGGVAVGRRGDRGSTELRISGRSDATVSSSEPLAEIWPDAEPIPWSSGSASASASGHAGPWALAGRLHLSGSRRSGIDHLALEPLPRSSHSSLIAGSATLEQGRTALVAQAQTMAWRTQSPSGERSSFTYDETQDEEASVSLELTTAPADAVELRAGLRAGVAFVEAPWLAGVGALQLHGFSGGWASADVAASPSVDLSAHARLDHSSQSRQPEPSWRLSALYHRARSSGRLSVSSAWREPSFVELASRFVDPVGGLILLEGDPELTSPRIASAEAGLIFSDRDGRMLAPTLFAQRATDLVLEDFGTIVRRTYGSADAPLLVGAELEALLWSTRQLSTTASVTGLHWLGDDAQLAGATAGIPSHSSALTAALRADGGPASGLWTVGGFGLYRSVRTWDVVTGIPPVMLSATAAPSVQVGLSATVYPGRALSVGTTLLLDTAAGRPAAPYAWGAEPGHAASVVIRFDPQG